MADATTGRPLPAWFWVAVPAALWVGLSALALATSAPLGPIAPLVAQVGAVLVLLLVLWKRRRGLVPWFEIGVVYSSIVALYGTYALLKFLVVGEDYHAPLIDTRWTFLDPSAREVTSTGWIYAAHLIGFVGAYLIARGRPALAPRPLQPHGLSVFLAAGAVYAGVQAFWIYLGLFYDTSAGSYVETYLVSRRLPLVLAQLLNHLNGAKYPLSLVMLAWLFAHYASMKRYIFAWIGLLALLSFVRLGSRTELALMIMAAGAMYNAFVRPAAPSTIGLGAAAGLAAFILLGILRSGGEGGSFNPLLRTGEFDVVFGNALELARARTLGMLPQLPPALFFADFAALIPQQIAPFQKVDPSLWYVTTFYPEYAATGGGLAFGTMAEAALAGGWIAGAVRGAALGAWFALVHRVYIRHGHRPWVLIFYVWLVTLSYQAFRATTFAHLVMIAFRFLPVVIGVTLLSAGLQRAAAMTRYRSATAVARS